ncbi:hypothetical protein PCL_02382 [Purpureocillium lilacinum]|uniref:Uncharacterized protein n=1 Tax=Purpureocillium lilacinum TaxID=33203 RepID=A0A2U3E0D6_PURLI|nr:hypothetical protein Purlil1_11603 [Purpureocillium lilacinum]PWI67981.1 hypothetical protein PCL_02382 [Purpureocillium lilacinum]
MGAGGHGFVCRRTVARGAGCTHARMHASTNARTHARTKRGGGGSWRNGAPHLSQEQAAFDGEAKRQRCPSEGGGNSAAVLPLSLSRLVLGTSRSYGSAVHPPHHHPCGACAGSRFEEEPVHVARSASPSVLRVLVSRDWPGGLSRLQTPRNEDKTNMCRSTGPSWWLQRPRHGRWRHRQRRQTMATMETDKAEEDEEGIGSNPELSHAGAHDGFSRICSQGCASKLVVGVPVQEVGRAGR